MAHTHRPRLSHDLFYCSRLHLGTPLFLHLLEDDDLHVQVCGVEDDDLHVLVCGVDCVNLHVQVCGVQDEYLLFPVLAENDQQLVFFQVWGAHYGVDYIWGLQKLLPTWHSS